MKKYFYIGILVGTVALSGCTNDEANSKEVTAETLTTEQSSAFNNKANTTKKEETAPIPLKLTEEQKEEYYQKYVTIIEKVNTENEEDYGLELEPITAFLDGDWIKAEEFEKLAKERANASIIVVGNNERYNPMSVPKTVKLQIGSKEAIITFTASFNTQLNSGIPGGRQEFSVFDGISSEVVKADGSWTQLGYDESLVDGDTVYNIAVGGKYSQSGIISSHIIEMEFHCNKNGGIS